MLKRMGEYYKGDMLLPSAASIKRVFAKIEKVGDITKVPYKLLHLEEGGNQV
jgi:hypothetical protein